MTAREGQTMASGTRLANYANFVRLPHTVFALPFALVGAALATYQAPMTVRIGAAIVVAFTAARFAAMGFNRIVDREIDARNPRTAQRELPRGAMSIPEARWAVAVASAVFVLAAAMLNPLCGWLSPVALGWVFFYSYTKRFTRFSHLVLGVGMSIAPVGGYLAVTGRWSHPWWMLIALSLAVTTWGGGFDVLYALQDVGFDRAQGLHSLPAMIGEHQAITAARVMHVATVLSLVAVGCAVGLNWIYVTGVCVAASLLLYEHSLVRPNDLSKLDAAFFTMNGIISIVFFGFVLASRLVK